MLFIREPNNSPASCSFSSPLLLKIEVAASVLAPFLAFPLGLTCRRIAEKIFKGKNYNTKKEG